MQNLSLLAFWTPRYWPTWMGLGLLWLVIQLPYSWQLKMGGGLGRLSYYLLKRRRRIAEVNVQLCFPELTTEERIELVKKNFASIGMGVIEMGMSMWMSSEKLEKLISIEGLEFLDAAFARGKGVIMLGAHFTTLDLIARLFAERYPLDILYRPAKNKLIETILSRKRQQSFSAAIERSAIRTMLHQLKLNRAVWYAPDQDYGRKHSVFVPFFGVPTATITATSRLARMSNAAVIPSFQYRKPNNQGYQIVFNPPMENFPTQDDEHDAQRVNQEIEKAIRKAPEQYLWPHRRFKTRPLGEMSFYQHGK